MKHTKVYGVWSAMLSRCNNPHSAAFHNYGGRGIRVCDRWTKFTVFLADMGEPTPGMTLDRIDNARDYCPDNCRWSDRKMQGRNTRRNRHLTVRGDVKLMCEWAEIVGISVGTIHNRLRLGWTDEQAVLTPLVTKRKGIKRGQKLVDAYGSQHGVEWTETDKGGFMDERWAA